MFKKLNKLQIISYVKRNDIFSHPKTNIHTNFWDISFDDELFRLVPILMFDYYLDKIGIRIPFWDISFDHGLFRLVPILMFDYYLDKIGIRYLDITFEHGL